MINDEYTYATTRSISFMVYLKDDESAEDVANKYMPILEKAFPEYSDFEFVKQSYWMVVIYPKDHIAERRVEYAWYWEEDFPVIDQMNIYDDETSSIVNRFNAAMKDYDVSYEIEFDYEDNVVDVTDNIKKYVMDQYGG